MTTPGVIRGPEDLSLSWLSDALGHDVESFSLTPGHGNWSHQWSISVRLVDGTTRAMRLKVCLGDVFGSSEVHYYTRDYVGMERAPLVPCADAQFDPAVGYHVLLDDLSATHSDRREVQPTLEYGLAVAEALGRLHRHHWGAQEPPGVEALDRYFDEVRPGLLPLERATGHALSAGFGRHEGEFRRRWAQPHGMSLIHGDLNPTNILTPVGSDSPVYFLDRQPFDWSLLYGVAASDLAYFLVPWWPEEVRSECELPVLRLWYEALGHPEYSWSDARADWRLSVEQCLNVPMEWCSKETTLESMRWLWEKQFARIQNALVQPGVVV